MVTENDTLMEIVHLASAALVVDQPDVKRQAMADIYDAIASILPVERAARRSAPTVVGRDVPGAPEEPQGLAAFLRISDRLQLVRFRGPDFVQLVGRIKAHNGTPNQVFEIHVDKDDRSAVVYRDEKPLWTITGTGRVNSSLVEQLAVSTLHRWWKSTRRYKKEAK